MDSEVVKQYLALRNMISSAYYEGFGAAILQNKWDGCYDWAAVKGQEYANELLKQFMERQVNEDR